MIYRVLKRSEAGNMVKHGDYNSAEEADSTKANLKSRSKARQVKIVKVPENIGVNYEIFNIDESPYGTIAKETNYFYYIEPHGKITENQLDMRIFIKTDFLDKFEEEIFLAVDGDIDKIQKYEESLDESGED